MTRLIGLSGYARSGKNSLGDILSANCGFKPVAFADRLKGMAQALDPLIYTGRMHGASVPLHTILNAGGGWEDAKTHPGVREFLQSLGVAARQHISETVWIDALLSSLDTERYRYVITDVRFPNEADAVRERGGQVWRIERPGTGPANDHESEHALSSYQFDRIIHNDGALQDLREKVLRP